jgi:hypothetical protein
MKKVEEIVIQIKSVLTKGELESLVSLFCNSSSEAGKEFGNYLKNYKKDNKK